MRHILALLILIASVLAVYPVLVGLAILLDTAVGDGTASHYLLASTNLRLSMREVQQDWIGSLPVAVVLVAVLAVLTYAARRSTASMAAKLVIALMTIVAAFAIGVYVGSEVWTGVLYALWCVVIGMMTTVALWVSQGGACRCLTNAA